MRMFPTFIAATSLCLCSCENKDQAGATDAPAPPPLVEAPDAGPEAGPEAAPKPSPIDDLQRDIEKRQQIIEDLGAAVLMERTKLEDDPGYDQGFLNEILADQQQQREEIGRIRKQIEELNGSGE